MNHFLNLLSALDPLATLVISSVLVVGLCVYRYSLTYMRGDAQYYSSLQQLILLIFSVSGQLSTHNLIVLLSLSILSNILLVRLMIHKSSWRAAKASGILAIKTYLLSTLCLGMAFIIYYRATDAISIKGIADEHTQSPAIRLSLVFLLLGAMMQSAIWPFHRWLTSSLNSPTPVLALMHGVLLNGGIFLLVRFAPLYLQHPKLLTFIFLLGVASSLMGALFQLIQHDVKRMLAYSTMKHLGLMLIQCGLGFFPAAITHLICHSGLKTYLLLNSSGNTQAKGANLFAAATNLFAFICSLLCGLMASIAFGYASGYLWFACDTTIVMMTLIFLIASESTLPILRFKTLRGFSIALLTTTLVGLSYGASIKLIVWMMGPIQLMQPQPLNGFHLIGIIAVTIAWLSLLLLKNQSKTRRDFPLWALKAYVVALNTSQPHPETVTTHRNQYQYS